MEFIIIISGVITMGFILILCIEGWNLKNISMCLFFLSLTMFSVFNFSFYRTEKNNTSISDNLQINDVVIKFEKPMVIREIYKKPFLSISKYDIQYTISNIEKK